MVPEPTHGTPGRTPDNHVEAELDVTLESIAGDTTTDAVVPATATVTEASHVGLDSIERTILHARIAALERALEAKDRQRTAIIDQYEAILAERDRDDGAVAIEFEDADDEQGLLGTLQTILGRR